MGDKIDQLYDALKADGAVEKSRDNFRSFMLAKGKQGYQNRKQLYEALKADGAVSSPTYEEFGKRLGLVAVKDVKASEQTKQQAPARMQGKPEKMTTYPVPSAADEREPMQTYRVDALETGAKEAPIPERQQAYKPTWRDEIKLRQALGNANSAIESAGARTAAMKKRTEHTNPLRNDDVVKGDFKPNAETGAFEQTYITPQGNESFNRKGAEIEAAVDKAMYDDSVLGQMARARAELAELQEQADRRGRLVQEQYEKEHSGYWSKVFEGAKAGRGMHTALPGAVLDSDAEFSALRTAIRQRDEQIKTLEEQYSRETSGDGEFWSGVKDFGRGFGRTVGSLDTWDFGQGAMSDASAMVTATKNDRYKTEGQRAAEQKMMAALYEKETAEGRYSSGTLYGWGVMTGHMPRFMAEFGITNGGGAAINTFGKLGAKGAVKLVGRQALKEMAGQGVKGYVRANGIKGAAKVAGKKIITALGTTADDLLLRAPMMTNTIQGARTAADIVDRKVGDVVANSDGTYNFENDKSWSSAVWQAEANSIVENASEMFGTHLEGFGKKMSNVFGPGRISRILSKTNAEGLQRMMEATGKQFSRLGVSDYIGETTEELYGQLLRTALNLDDAYMENADGTRTNLFATGKFYSDIYCGMAISMGMMGVGKHAMTGINYAHAKHQVNKAGRCAAAMFTEGEWDALKEKIDNTSNDDIGKVLRDIGLDKTLTEEQKAATAEYVGAMMGMRGFNLADLARMRSAGVNQDAQNMSDAYMRGYNARDSRDRNDAKHMYEVMEERLRANLNGQEGMDADAAMAAIEADPVEALLNTPGQMRQPVIDYINAKMVYDGMIRSVQDNIEEEMAASDAMIDTRVHRQTGAIQSAVMTNGDRAVYVINGELAVNDDGSIDHRGSDKSVLVRDAETGVIEFVDPYDMARADAPVDAEQQKIVARMQIRQKIAEEAANQIDGRLSFAAGEKYDLKLGDEITQVTVVGPAVDKQGAPVEGLVTVEFEDGSRTDIEHSTVQQMADDAARQRAIQNTQQGEAAEDTADDASAEGGAPEAEQSAGGYKVDDTVKINVPGAGEMEATVTALPGSNGYMRVTTSQPIGGEVSHRLTPAELDALSGRATSNAEINDRADSAEQQENDAESSLNESVPALSRIPLDANGKPDFTAAESADVAWDALMEKTRNEASAKGFADNMVARVQKVLQKAKQVKPMDTADIDTFAESEERRKAAIKDAEKRLKKWQEIAATPQRRAEEEQMQTSTNGFRGRPLTDQEATELVDKMENTAESALAIELTPENWIAQFGEDGKVDTPMGVVKLGENQFMKLFSRKRTEYFGMIKPTLTNPDVVIEKIAPANGAERDSKLLFVKTFIKPDGSRIVHFESITVQRDGMEVSISSHEAEAKDIKKDMQKEQILHISERLSLSSEWSLTEAPQKAEGPDLVPTSDNSESKGNANLADKQESGAESSPIGAVSVLSKIPLDANGKPDFTAAESADVAWDALMEKTRDKETAKEFADNMIIRMQKMLQKAKQVKPMDTADIDTFAESEGRRNAAIKEAEERLKKWQEVAATPQRRAEEEQMQATAKASKEPSITEQEAKEMIAAMEARSETASEIELTPENWTAQFGEDGVVSTPIGEVKMGDNQYLKMARQGRAGKLGMIKPTLENPDIVVEELRPAVSGKSERDTSLIFIKAFRKSDGERYYYFTSVTVQKDGKEVIISNQEKSINRISRLLQDGTIVWIKSDGILHPKSQAKEPVPSSDPNSPTVADNQAAMLGIDSHAVSDSKDNANSTDKQENDAESSLSGAVSALSRIPLDANGKPDFMAAESADVAWDALMEKTRDEASAKRFADNMAVRMQKMLQKAKQVKPMDTDDIDAFAESEGRRKAAIKEAEERLKKWQEIASTPQRRAEEEQMQTSTNGFRGRPLTEQEATELVDKMESTAEEAHIIELTPENWIAQFGKDGQVTTPMGIVKLGENQFMKLYNLNRAGYFGMMYPTLSNPDVVIEKSAPANGAERDSKLLFVKTFTKPNGGRVVHFESITVKRDGMEVSISSHEAEGKAIKREMQNGKILHLNEKLSPSSEWYLTEAPQKAEGPDLVPTSDNSDSKGNANLADKQERGAEAAEGGPAQTGGTRADNGAAAQAAEQVEAGAEAFAGRLGDVMRSVMEAWPAPAMEQEQGKRVNRFEAPTEEQAMEATQQFEKLLGEATDEELLGIRDAFMAQVDRMGLSPQMAWTMRLCMEKSVPAERKRKLYEQRRARMIEENPAGGAEMLQRELNDVIAQINGELGTSYAPISAQTGWSVSEGALQRLDTMADGHLEKEAAKEFKMKLRQMLMARDLAAGMNPTDIVAQEGQVQYSRGKRRVMQSHPSLFGMAGAQGSLMTELDTSVDFKRDHAPANGSDINAAEEANAAIDSYAQQLADGLQQMQQMQEQQDTEQVQVQQMEQVLTEAGTRLEKQLQEYYRSQGSSQADANAAARDMAAQVRAEVTLAMTQRSMGEQRRANAAATAEEVQKEAQAWQDSEAEPQRGAMKTAAGQTVEYESMGGLRTLQEGEFTHVERKFSQTGEFGFTGAERIESIDDVAYIFRSLEDYSKENAFAVLVKDGRPTVMHIGMGTINGTMADMQAVYAAVKAYGADKVYFVHNHPSGNLNPSIQDQQSHRKLDSMLGGGVLQESIIIDLRSGRYGVFDATDKGVREKKQSDGAMAPVKVRRFDRHVFSPDYDLNGVMTVRSAEDIAAFLSSHRLGERGKISFLILDNANHVVGNIHTPYQSYTDSLYDLADQLVDDAVRFGGRSVVPYGNVKLDGIRHLTDLIKRRGHEVQVLDALQVSNSLCYKSAYNAGLMGEENAGYEATPAGKELTDGERLLAIRELEPVEVNGNNLDRKELFSIYRELPSVQKDGQEIRFLRAAFGKNYKEGGLFAQTVPVLNDVLEQSVLAYSDSDSYGGTLRPDGTEHKAHPNVTSFDNYVGKIRLDSQNYYVRFTVQKTKDSTTGVHSCFVSNVELYENATLTGTDSAIFDRPNQGQRGIVDTKLQQFFERASSELNQREDEELMRDGTAGPKAIEEAWNSELTTAREAAAEQQRMRQEVTELAAEMGLDNVDILEDASTLTGRRRNAKGFYNRRTGKITVVLSNNLSVEDAKSTLLHEAVGHHGLRKLLGERFTQMLDSLYAKAPESVRRRIAQKAARMGWDFRTATEEYLAEMAEDGSFMEADRGWWNRMKRMLRSALRAAGIDIAVSDNEMRYLLWRSYRNLTESLQSMMGAAEDIAMQQGLKVGEFAEAAQVTPRSQAEAARLRETNRRFNQQLGEWDNGKLPASEQIDAGMPAGIMRRFLPELPVILRQKVLSKSRKKHGLTAAELKNLPEAMSKPIFVFKSNDSTVSMLTELQSEKGENIFVAVAVGANKQLGHVVMEVNDILTVHGREAENVILPIVENGTLAWADKTKGLQWLSSAKSNSQAIASETLDSAAKIVENFENPAIEEQNYNDEADADVLLRQGEGVRLRETNRRFNQQLEEYKAGTIPKNKMLDVGKPLGIMRQFLPNIPIVVRQRVLTKANVKKHDVDLMELINMPEHLSNPIFIFQRGQNSIGVLTEMHDRNGKNICVAVEIDSTVQEGGKYIEVTDIRSIHGRNAENIILPIISNGTLKWVDKEKGLDWLSSASPNAQQEIAQQDLDRAAKIVENFENPAIEEQNYNDEADVDVLLKQGDEMFGDSEHLQDRVLNAKIALAARFRSDMGALDAAVRGTNARLSDLRRSLTGQKEYDRARVKRLTDLVQTMMRHRMLQDMNAEEEQRVQSAISNALAMRDVNKAVEKLMDVMTSNQLRTGELMLQKLIKVAATKVDTKGMEAQALLDLRGQRVMEAFKQSYHLPAETFTREGELKGNCVAYLMQQARERLDSADDAIRSNAEAEYAGLALAYEYAQQIGESKEEEQEIRRQMQESGLAKREGRKDKEVHREFMEAAYERLRTVRMERAEAYREMAMRLKEVIAGGKERATAFRAAERDRIRDIQHDANRDMLGRPADAHRKDSAVQKWANNGLLRFFLKPLATFDQMLRMFGRNSVNGEGYLYDRFMNNGWLPAKERYYQGREAAMKELDDKVSEVMGRKMRWSGLYSMERKMPKHKVSIMDADGPNEILLTQGNLLYIYMANKMEDGKMKLRKMGITEEDVAGIAKELDPRFVKLADWLQEEYLPKRRNGYNAVHERLTGAPMGAIENYFPLRILSNARTENVDVGQPLNNAALPSTTTGSVIKRRTNSLPLDIANADAFSVTVENVDEMERWAAFAEFNRDLNTLLSYKRFRNQVMGMASMYGGGKLLWNNFRDCCRIAAGTYRPRSDNDSIDGLFLNVAKGVTTAKITGRLYTALKQFLSFPAYFSEASTAEIFRSIFSKENPWRWAMEELPVFRERWLSRQSGDSRLKETDQDWRWWKTRLGEAVTRHGMSPNAFVDALTVSIGAHAIYKTKRKRYLKYGFSEEKAEEMAKRDATISFNQTQQSSEDAFMSAMQLDRTTASVAVTVFRNSSMGYQRQLMDSMRTLKRMMFEKGYREKSIAFMTGKYRTMGLDEAQAQEAAEKEYARAKFREAARFAIFGFVMQFAWNLGGYMVYLLAGDDDDKKEDMLTDAAIHAAFGGLEGFTGGSLLSEAGNMWVQGKDFKNYDPELLPMLSDAKKIWQHFDDDAVAGANDLVNLLIQSGAGVNPQTITDVAVAMYDACNGDLGLAKESGLLIMRILAVPQSQIDALYLDEIKMSGAEAAKLSPQQLAERYAKYKRLRGAPLTSPLYSDEARGEREEKYAKRFLKMAKGRYKEGRRKDMEAYFNMWDEEYESTKAQIDSIRDAYANDLDAQEYALGEFAATGRYERSRRYDRVRKKIAALEKEWAKAKTPEEMQAADARIAGIENELQKMMAGDENAAQTLATDYGLNMEVNAPRAQ